MLITAFISEPTIALQEILTNNHDDSEAIYCSFQFRWTAAIL